MNWFVKRFDELSGTEIYGMLQLRAEVFVVEQNCVYQDIDGKDEKSLHVFGYVDNALVAYARIVLPGISYKEMSIGRVVVSLQVRGKSIGIELMNQTINFGIQILGEHSIRISAQTHLERFYKSIGFAATGKSYLEDGIPHIEMLRL